MRIAKEPTKPARARSKHTDWSSEATVRENGEYVSFEELLTDFSKQISQHRGSSSYGFEKMLDGKNHAESNRVRAVNDDGALAILLR